ncbi:MAG: response regulator [Cytophagaceae bacterium]|nr:MAG: response regulator [Cytophagaceae bacterium]
MEQNLFQRAKFLLVDDEIANIRLLAKMLNQWQATEIISTTHPEQTFALFTEFQPDIILLDLMMPETDGFQVMEQLRPLIHQNDYLPILVLTADATHQTKHRALASGATDFLAKPFDALELSLRIQNLLRTRFLHQRLHHHNQVLDLEVRERTIELAQSEIETIECLAQAAEFRDDDTGQHTRRVGHTAALLAQKLGLEAKDANLIRRAAPLHDVGKIGIPDSILLKPGKLTAQEFDTMKTHTTIGYRILARHHTKMLQLAASIALTHHERWDGTGYPQSLSAENIAIEGRLVAVADVFDALTHARPYKEAWSLEQAVTEIRHQSGLQFDPRIVEAFLTLPHAELI